MRWLGLLTFVVCTLIVAIFTWGLKIDGPSFVTGMIGAVGMFGWASFLMSLNEKVKLDNNNKSLR